MWKPTILQMYELILTDSTFQEVLGGVDPDWSGGVCSRWRDGVGLLHAKQHGSTAKNDRTWRKKMRKWGKWGKPQTDDEKKETLEKIQKWKTKPLHGQILRQLNRTSERWEVMGLVEEGGFEERDWMAYNSRTRSGTEDQCNQGIHWKTGYVSTLQIVWRKDAIRHHHFIYECSTMDYPQRHNKHSRIRTLTL